MNVHFQQSTRLARIETALGPDELALLRLEGEERVNTLFLFEVDALSARSDIDFDELIGTHLTAEVDHPDHGVQPFDGIVTQARYKGVGENGYRYGFALRPWFWLLGKRRNQRIFHEMTVVEILQELFEPYADMGAPSYELRLAKDYPKLEYTVQFAEKDLNVLVRNSDAKVVMNDSAEAVMDNKLTEVIGNRIDSTGGSMTIFTGPAGPGALRTQDIGFQTNTLSRIAYSLDRPQLKKNGAPGDFTIVSDGSHDISAKGSAQHHYGRNFDTSVGRNLSTRVQGNRSARVNGDSSDNVKKNRVDFVGETYTIVVGQSRIEMKKDGTIKISGNDITIEGSKSIKLKSARIDLN